MSKHIPAEFIPDGTVSVTNYTTDDLPELADEIADVVNVPSDTVLEQLNWFCIKNDCPVAVADKALRLPEAWGQQ
jgi:hypothetical protein